MCLCQLEHILSIPVDHCNWHMCNPQLVDLSTSILHHQCAIWPHWETPARPQPSLCNPLPALPTHTHKGCQVTGSLQYMVAFESGQAQADWKEHSFFGPYLLPAASPTQTGWLASQCCQGQPRGMESPHSCRALLEDVT